MGIWHASANYRRNLFQSIRNNAQFSYIKRMETFSHFLTNWFQWKGRFWYLFWNIWFMKFVSVWMFWCLKNVKKNTPKIFKSSTNWNQITPLQYSSLCGRVNCALIYVILNFNVTYYQCDYLSRVLYHRNSHFKQI